MPNQRYDQQQPATSDKEIVAECVERLRIAMEAESENRASAMEALEFGNGKQWPDDLYNQRRIAHRPSLTINHTNTIVRRVVNNMRQQRPRIKVHPVGDGAIQEVAALEQGLVRHVENRSTASVAYDTAGESAVRIGWGYWRVHSEWEDEGSFNQELRISAIRNVFTVYLDPAAAQPTGSDAEWCILTELMPWGDYRRKFPQASDMQFRDTSNGDETPGWMTRTHIRLAEYYRIRRVKDTLFQMSNGMTLFADDIRKFRAVLDFKGVTVAKDSSGKPISRESYRQRVEWYKINGTEIVDRRSLDDNPLPDKWIPVVRVEGNVLDMNGKVIRKGMIADLMDPARMLNYWKTCETELIALSPKSPWLAASGQTAGHPEWKDANQTSYNVMEYEPVTIEQPDGSQTPLPPPQRIPPPQVPAAFVQAAQGAFQDLLQVAGMPHEPAKDMPGQVVSGIALRNRQALSDISHFQYYDNQTLAIAHTGMILLSLFPHYYSARRMQRIIGDDGTPEMVEINVPQQNPENPAVRTIKNDLTVGRYDVVMDTGPGYETKRQESAEAMIDLLKTPLAEPIVKVGADLVVRNMDFAGSSELADRLMPMNPQGMDKIMKSLPKEARSVVTALFQHLQAAQQALQNLQMELKYKGGIEQMRQAGETEREGMRASTKVHDVERRAESAERVAEITAAGKIIDTHAAKGHEHTMQERELVADAVQAAREAQRDATLSNRGAQ